MKKRKTPNRRCLKRSVRARHQCPCGRNHPAGVECAIGRKASRSFAGPAGSAADDILEKIIMRLKTHRSMWAGTGGNMATLPSDGQCKMMIEDLRKCRRLMRHNGRTD